MALGVVSLEGLVPHQEEPLPHQEVGSEAIVLHLGATREESLTHQEEPPHYPKKPSDHYQLLVVKKPLISASPLYGLVSRP